MSKEALQNKVQRLFTMAYDHIRHAHLEKVSEKYYFGILRHHTNLNKPTTTSNTYYKFKEAVFNSLYHRVFNISTYNTREFRQRN